MAETTPEELGPKFSELKFSCYGVRMRVTDLTGNGICHWLRENLPPEFEFGGSADDEIVFEILNASNDPGSSKRFPYRICCNGVTTFAGLTEKLLDQLNDQIDEAVARCSRQRVFLRAGVVGWRGLAILIPGPSLSGKSMLVAELVRRGAEYYSDKFAVLDDAGAVHSYRRGLVLRDKERTEPNDLRLIREDASPKPLHVGLIVATPYRKGTAWRPAVLRGTPATLSVLESAVRIHKETDRIVQLAARIAPNVVKIFGLRPDASEAAPRILDAIDDALISKALAAGSRADLGRGHVSAGESVSRVADPALAAELAAICETRLHFQTGQRAPFSRRLVAARYLRIEDFLSAEDHSQVLNFALAQEHAFEDSGVLDPQGRSQKDYGFRKSRTLSGPLLETIWPLFERRLSGMLPYARKQLALPWFSLGKVERQLTAHSGGGFFAPHVDTGNSLTATRRISCVYYFHAQPRRFTGGELKVYDAWVTERGSTAAPTCTTLTPIDNSIVFFPSNEFHEVRPVHVVSGAFRDSRFAITIWFREGPTPPQLAGLPTHG